MGSSFPVFKSLGHKQFAARQSFLKAGQGRPDPFYVIPIGAGHACADPPQCAGQSLGFDQPLCLSLLDFL